MSKKKLNVSKKMSFPILFVDMDEVLVDFRGGACKVHGLSLDHVDQRTLELNCWDLAPTIGIDTDQFWDPIHKAGHQFWQELEPLPWFDALVSLLSKHEWFIVTSPSRCPSSYYGKMLWIHRYLGAKFHNVFLNSNKHLFGYVPRSVLIDDRADNCTKFATHGGKAILFPSIGNVLRHYRHDPIPYVQASLQSVLMEISKCHT